MAKTLLRLFVANRLIDLAWVAWFFMAKEIGAKLCRGARRMVEGTQ